MNHAHRCVELYQMGGLPEVKRGVSDFVQYRLVKLKWWLLNQYARARYGTHHTRRVEDVLMTLDLSDRGISTELAIRGTREERTMRQYKQALASLGERRDGDITVVDIGANIGYYALQPPAILGDRAHVIAVEPIQENVELLRANVVLNGYEGSIDIVRSAVGDRDGTVEMRVSKRRNGHAVSPLPVEDANGSEEVPVRTLSNLLEQQGVRPGDVDVLRIDVEGYEAKILDAADDVFDSESDMLVNIELHNESLSDREFETIVDRLGGDQLSIISAERCILKDRYAGCDIERLADARQYGVVEMIGWVNGG